MKFESLEQVSRPATISKSVEVGQNFVTQPASRWTKVEITTTCREDTAVIVLQPKQKVYWEITPSLGPSTTQGLLQSMDDMVQKYRSIFLVKKGQSRGWSYRYVTEVSARCNESMYPETVTLQNASSSTERTVEGTTLATRSTSPREKVPPPHLTG